LGTGGLFLRKLRARVADEPTGFVWVEKGKLAGSGYPASKAQVEWLAKAGVRSILTLTEESLPSEWSEGLDIETGHVPMKDHEVPSVKSMGEGVMFIVEEMRRGRPVLVHCLAGEGRTGCVLSAYLVRTKGVGAEEAMADLRKVKPEFVERQQEKAVYEFAAGEGGPRTSV
jgi:atypical dual specificity phosphatase